jgi:hypothetical protein
MMKKSIIAVLMAGALLLNAGALFAQGSTKVFTQRPTKLSTEDEEIKSQLQDLRSQKKQIVSANMQLNEAESLKFWPVYDEYTAETIKINDTRVALIKEYTGNYDALTDAQAQSLLKKWLQADDAEVQLRLKYIPIFSKALPAKKTARFIQIDRHLGILIDVQVMSAIPIVQP